MRRWGCCRVEGLRLSSFVGPGRGPVTLHSRRRLFQLSAAALGLAAVGRGARAGEAPGIDDLLAAAGVSAPTTATPAPAPPPDLAPSASARSPSPAGGGGSDAAILAAVRAGLARAGGKAAHADVVAVADFARPSSAPRLHLVEMASGRIESLLVAHGKGSDPAHTGWLQSFSNVVGSDATSEGDYLTGPYYDGHHGRAMRLQGLDPTNSNAAERAIVVHAAAYVSPQIVRAHGVLGRSEGCFAVCPADIKTVLERLGPGRLLIATRL